jgi:hypothetical protein
VPISDDIKEKKLTSAANAQTLTGRRVLTGTPPSMVMAIVPRGERPYGANAEGGAPFLAPTNLPRRGFLYPNRSARILGGALRGRSTRIA